MSFKHPFTRSVSVLALGVGAVALPAGNAFGQAAPAAAPPAAAPPATAPKATTPAGSVATPNGARVPGLAPSAGGDNGPAPLLPPGVGDEGPGRLDEVRARFQSLRSGKGLTAEETARRTVKNSPAIEAKQRALENVDAQASQTLWAYSPRLKLTASYTRLSPVHPDLGFPPPPTDPIQLAVYNAIVGSFSTFTNIPVNSTVFDASLSVPLSDYVLRLSHAQAGADRAREAAVFDRGATNAAVDRDARVSYYSWVRAQSQELIAEAALEQATGHLKDATNAFQAGLLSKADVLGAEVAKKNSELLLERARNNTELARLSLQVAMGDAPGRKYEIGEDVFAPNTDLQSLPESSAGLREAESHRMEFKSLVASERAYRENASLARVGDFPRLDGVAGVTYANPNQRYFPLEQKFHTSWQAGVALTWAPTDIGGAEATRRASVARAEELVAQRRQFLDGLKLEIDQALKAAEEARFTIDVAGQALASSEEGYRVRRELFRAGRATIVELTDAETDLTRTRLQLVDAHINGRIAVVQLRHALGRDTEAARATKAP